MSGRGKRVRNGLFPAQKGEKVAFKPGGVEHRRSPPVCFSGTGRCIILISGFCTEMQLCTFINFYEDWMRDRGYSLGRREECPTVKRVTAGDGRYTLTTIGCGTGDHSAQRCLLIGETPRFLLVLSNLSTFMSGKSGATLRIRP